MLLLLAFASSSNLVCASVIPPRPATPISEDDIFSRLLFADADENLMPEKDVSAAETPAGSPVIVPEVPDQKAFQQIAGGGASRTGSTGGTSPGTAPATADLPTCDPAGGILLTFLPNGGRVAKPLPVLLGIFRPPRMDAKNL